MDEMRWDKLLDWYLEYERKHLHRSYSTKRDGWRASSFGYCPRRQFLERAGVERTEVIDAKKRRTFAWGDNVHTFVKRLFWRLGLMLGDEVPLQYGTLTGHMDALVGGVPRSIEAEDPERVESWSPEYREFIPKLRTAVLEQFGDALIVPTGLEIKSAHSYAMRKVAQEGPYPWHSGQVAAMALCVSKSESVPTDEPTFVAANGIPYPRPARWRILYVGKDSTGALQFGLPGGSIAWAAERLVLLDEAWEAMEAPPCTCDESGERGWCAYKSKNSCCGEDDWDRMARLLAKSLERSQART